MSSINNLWNFKWKLVGTFLIIYLSALFGGYITTKEIYNKMCESNAIYNYGSYVNYCTQYKLKKGLDEKRF